MNNVVAVSCGIVSTLVGVAFAVLAFLARLHGEPRGLIDYFGAMAIIGLLGGLLILSKTEPPRAMPA